MSVTLPGNTPLAAYASVDFMSVTVPYVMPDADVALWQRQAALAATHPDAPVWLHDFLIGNVLAPAMGRKGHSASISHADTGAVFFMGGTNTVSVFEAGGRACRLIGTSIGDEAFASAAAKTCTRIDVAVDFDLPPADIASYVSGWSKRIKAHSWVTSPTGQTLYLGSPTSERFARIYRYAEPHPRAKFLRVEIVSRRKHAKSVCEAIQAEGLAATAATLLAKLELQGKHFASFEPSSVPITPIENKRTSARRLLWLLRQVTPAILDMHRNREFDAREWFEKHIEGEL